MAYLPKPESGTKYPSTRRNNPLVRTTTSESLEICFKAFMVFRVVTLGVVVRKQKIYFFAVVKLHTCLNIIFVFYIAKHANLATYSTDKFTHLGYFANSAVCCIFLRFLPSNFAFMIRKMPLVLLGTVRRISLMALNEFPCFCDFKIFDVVEVSFWRIMASTLGHFTCLLEI